jgi:quercetin dioxygenase-like cupin family protein
MSQDSDGQGGKMKRFAGVAVIFMSALAVAAAGQETEPQHGATLAGEIQWAPGPPSLPAGARLAVLEGDPTQEGIFTMRLSMPDGYRIPPHWHPAFEHVTVPSGTFNAADDPRKPAK